MNNLRTLLNTEAYILLDGAMGTMLFAAGLPSGHPPEEWNVSHPEQVRAIHRSYIQAGSRLVLSNSFGGNRLRLSLHNLQDRAVELNRAAAQNLRFEAESAPHLVVCAGSMGPTGAIMEPYGTLTFEEARSAFAEQAAGLAEGGVDVFWIETMSDLQEVQAAVEGARSVSSLPIAATMSFDTHGRTMMGVTPQKAIDTLGKLDLIVIGANCGTGPDELEATIKAMRAANPDTILVAKANAGRPQYIQGQLVYDGTPEVMAEYAVHVYKAGAKLIGACCGSTPAHIAAMATALNQLN
jgi:5-methyltetrahydrofolate--homocysteine methyltransferase